MVQHNLDFQPKKQPRRRRTFLDGIQIGLERGRAESLASWKPRNLQEAAIWLEWYDDVHKDAPEVDRKLIIVSKAALAVVMSTPTPRGTPHRTNDPAIQDLKELLLT